MSINRYLLPVVAALAIATTACKNDAPAAADAPAATDLKQELLGTWQTYQVNVAVNSADGLDSFRSEMITADIWENTYGMEPPVFYFQPDDAFRRLHRALAGQVLDEATGTWRVNGDTLFLDENGKTTSYAVKFGSGKAAFRTTLDWDSDGQIDDEYQSVHRKISIGTE